MGSFNTFWGLLGDFGGRSTFFGVKVGDFGVAQHFLGWILRILGCLDFGDPLTFFGANLAGFSGVSLKILGAFGASSAFWGKLGAFGGS